MKKLLALIMTLAIVFCLCGCKEDSKRKKSDDDSSATEINLLCAENIDYIKSVEAEVDITICGLEDVYIDSMLNYYTQTLGAVLASDVDIEYFEMTQDMLEEYQELNDKISVEYIDPETSEFLEISTKYEDYPLSYGSIIVTSNVGGKERIKVLNFEDIYLVSSDPVNYQTISGNRLESALSSAIAYVTSTETKKAALLIGHSDYSYLDNYEELLNKNHYEVDKIYMTSISDDYDIIVIAAPTTDFAYNEINVLSDFLDNDGKLGKGIIYFADAACPPTPNLYAFLKEWGIEVGEGILFETNKANQLSPDSPSTMGIYPVSLEDDTEILKDVNAAITNYLVPMKVCEPSSRLRTATALMQTPDSVVVAPAGSSATWSDPDAKQQQFDCAIQSVETDFDKDNNTLTSYVMAFASVEFVVSEWAAYDAISNTEIVINCINRAAHVDYGELAFTVKVIEADED